MKRSVQRAVNAPAHKSVSQPKQAAAAGDAKARSRACAPAGPVGDPETSGLWEAAGQALKQQLQTPPIRPVARDGGLPLSFAQERLWMLNRSDSGNPVFNILMAWRITGPLDVSVLKRSLGGLMQRHELLRTAFRVIDRQPAQRICPGREMKLSVMDLRRCAPERRDAEALQVAEAEVQRPFDLAAGPLVRATLLRVSNDEHWLILVFHQIGFDGGSKRIVTRDLFELYRAAIEGRPAKLPVLPVQYADYASWVRERWNAPILDEQLAYWKQQLQGSYTPLRLPTVRAQAGAFGIHRVKTIRQEIVLSAALTDKLRRFSSQREATVFTVLIAALQALLRRYTRQDDIIVFASVANRNRSEIKDLIGLFAQLVVLRTDLKQASNFQTLLGRVRDVTVGALSNSSLPIDQIMEHLELSLTPERTSPFQIMFVFQNMASPAPSVPGLTITPLEKISSGAAKFDWYFEVADTLKELKLNLFYNANLFEADTVRNTLADYRKLLETVTDDAEQDLSTIALSPLTDAWPDGETQRMAGAVATCVKECRKTAFVPPADFLESQLARAWEKAFGIRPIGVMDNFFELGGHSLIAVRIFTQIEGLTGKSLPLVTLFQAPTVERLAAILRQEGWETPWASLVPIKPGGAKPPFYCVHGVGGNILEFLDLAKYMDEDQPFYGLQAIGLDGKRPIEDLTVEQMASRYIAEIRAFQPCGPYYLGGSSFGGLVAYEMAQQLRAAGQEIGLLAFFDTNGPGYPRLLPTTTVWKHKLDWWCDRVALHWGNLWASSGRQKLTYVREKSQRWRKQLRWKRQRHWDRVRERMGQVFWPHAIKQVRMIGYRAATTYEPKLYAGRATLFRATEQPRGIYEDRTLGWEPLVQGGLKIYDTPGHHGAIVREPRARALARQLTDALNATQAQGPSAPDHSLRASFARYS